jgi:hypothetical protein
MQRADSEKLNGTDELILRRGDELVVEGNIRLNELKVGRGSRLEVQGDLTVESDFEVYRRNSRVNVIGDLHANGKFNISRNSTVDVNGRVVFRGNKIGISRQSRLLTDYGIKSNESKIMLTYGSEINVKKGDLKCNTLRISDRNSEVLVQKGCLTADQVYVRSEDCLTANEVIADTKPRSSVNDSGKYVSEDEEEDEEDESLFDLSKDPKESVDVSEYNPNMDTSDLVVWIEARIMSQSENQRFPFDEFDRVVGQYPKLRNFLGSITTAEDAKTICSKNSNINLSQYQIDKIVATQKTAERADEDGVDELRRIGEEINEYDPRSVDYIEQSTESKAEDSDNSPDDVPDSDDMSAFDW